MGQGIKVIKEGTVHCALCEHLHLAPCTQKKIHAPHCTCINTTWHTYILS